MLLVLKRPNDNQIVATIGTGNKKSNSCRLDDMERIYVLSRKETAELVWEQRKLGMDIQMIR